MVCTTKIPSDLPQYARETTFEHPWPLRLLSVKIAEYINKMSRIWVEGEITGLVRRSNAYYQFFTLADLEENISINVKIADHALPAGIEPGSRVIVCAKPEFYTGNGSLSLSAEEVRTVGLGDILARIEQLKQRLHTEGLFAADRKQALPFLPRKIGLICGRNTKAMHDVVVNAKARWANIQFEIREVQVQGTGAVTAMLEALTELDALPEADVIIFARGGGSVEDLLPFSDEQLVRAVAAAKTPIISAIGHETDNPILDFVADYRASTPTDAAKRIVPDMAEEKQRIAGKIHRLRAIFENLLIILKTDLTKLRERPVLLHPEIMIENRNKELKNLKNTLNSGINHKIELSNTDLLGTLSHLRTLSPHSTISRGYSVLRKNDGSILTSVEQVTKNELIEAIVQDGSITLSTQTKTHKQTSPHTNSAHSKKHI